MENAISMATHYQTLADLHAAKAQEAMLPMVRDRLLSSAEKFATLAREYAQFTGDALVQRIEYIH